MKRTKQSTFARRERQEKGTGFAPVGGAQFTPGPWSLCNWMVGNNTPTGEVTICGPEGDEHICSMDGSENNQANGNLIAAAPAMYEALKEWCDYYAAYNPIRDKRIEPFIQLTRKALAQAEGRHPRKEETCK